MLNKILTVALAVVIVILLWEFYHNKNLENKLAIQGQNQAALSDSVRILKTKNGELEAAKFALAGSKDELKKLNEDLAKELAKEKGKVRYITKVEVAYKHDTVTIPAEISIHDSTATIRNDLVDDCRMLKAHTSFTFTKGSIIANPRFIIENDEFNLKLVTGLKQTNKKQLEIFVRSECKNVTIKDIQGAVIDPNDPLIKPKKALFTWWDATEIVGGIAIGFFINNMAHK